ncbi:UNVERIFIED_CONTAM: hypothetical protein Scaly_1308700 [Sesamum calycinum]|uniref:Uncharacterized protein n=1 Tax=Sesamum calycinum TaxID=2727403 RepID=A0AAW2Q7Q8_9LAMI
MGFTMGLNLLLLLAMVATNILSLYHLSSTIQSKPPAAAPVPDHLIHQLSTIRATINHLTSLQPSKKTPSTAAPAAPSDLLIYTHISPIASSCKDNPALLHQYMNYTPLPSAPTIPPWLKISFSAAATRSPPPLLLKNPFHHSHLASHRSIFAPP